MLAMVLCFTFYIGFGYIASLLESPIDLIFLNLGIAEHYSSIQRGVVDSRYSLLFKPYIFISLCYKARSSI